MSTVIVTGVPGVGKTTCLEAASEKAGYEVVVYGTEMLDTARSKGLVEDRDEMRRLDAETQREIQEAAAESIAAGDGDVLVDTHCTINTPEGYLPGIPEWVARALEPDQIVLVEATPDEIAGRRADDDSRDRDAESPEEIATHQEMNRAAAVSVAALTGATVKIVENHDGRVDEARADIVESLA
jgi:adenylate kinase